MSVLTRVARTLGPVVALTILVIACSGKPTPTPAPTALPPAAGPTLDVVAAEVQYRERETDELKALKVGDSMAVPPGANIVANETGRATLTWPMFLKHEMVALADTLLSLSEPNSRHVILDQAAGTGRYIVEGAGEPTDLQVNAGFVTVGQSVAVVKVSQGPADFIVSIDAGDKPIVWVAAVTGTAEVLRGTDTVTVAQGQVAAFGTEATLPTPLAVDPAVIQAWYDAVAAGKAEGGLATVAFRCQVTSASAKLLSDATAKAKPIGEPLPQGTTVDVLGRSEDAIFLRVSTVTGTNEGWMLAADLACVAPAGSAPAIVAGATATPTARGTRLPVRVTGTPTRPLAVTPTPTPTGTAPAFVFEFGADPGTIEAGECATLTWNVEGVREVYLDGSGVAGGKQSKKVCPDETTTYTLEVVKPDGTRASKSATVKVEAAPATPIPPTNPPAATNTPPPTNPPAATDTPQPQPSETPATQAPPR